MYYQTLPTQVEQMKTSATVGILYVDSKRMKAALQVTGYGAPAGFRGLGVWVCRQQHDGHGLWLRCQFGRAGFSTFTPGCASHRGPVFLDAALAAPPPRPPPPQPLAPLCPRAQDKPPCCTNA